MDLQPYVVAPVLARELEDTVKSKSPVLQTVKAIIAREESLNSLMSMSRYFEKKLLEELPSQVLIESIGMIHAHRMLTLNVVECISRWRQSLKTLLNKEEDFNPTFKWNGENYLIQMRNDCKEDDGRVLPGFQQFINFCEKSDPFFVFPSNLYQEFQPGKIQLSPKNQEEAEIARKKLTLKDGKLCIPIPESFAKRIRKAEVMIIEESANFRQIRETSHEQKI